METGSSSTPAFAVVMQGGSGLLPNPPVQGSREHSISSNATAASSGEARRAERGRGKTWLLDSKYVLGEELGRGSSGRVYRALNQGGGGSHFVAIKEIPLVGVVRSRPFKPSLSGASNYPVSYRHVGCRRPCRGV